jgi:hypothetical protein
MVAATVLSSIPAVSVAKTPQVTGTLGKGDYGVVDDTPYYGGFGAGFLHINADGTHGGKAVPCSIKAVNADEYEVRFDKPLKLDAKPLEVRIGSK